MANTKRSRPRTATPVPATDPPAAQRSARTKVSEATSVGGWQRAATLADLEPRGAHAGVKSVTLGGRTLALWRVGDAVYALDNRCPHMGFPLDRGTCKDGILTCHWHQARFDLRSGGTFDQFADDAQVFPVELRGDEIWVNLAATRDPHTYYRHRLRDGLEQDVRLVLAKSAIALLDGTGGDSAAAIEPFRIGLEFGVRNRRAGWGQGLTMHVCFANLLPYLDPDDRPRALYHGLDAVSRESAGAPPRFLLTPLPGPAPDNATLGEWLRQFLAVRDDEGAERALITAVHAGASSAELTAMLFTAVTDYRYLAIGHAADFTNKAFEALDLVGWGDSDLTATVLSSVAHGIAQGARQEESNTWRHPVDLVALLDAAFERIPGALAQGRARASAWLGRTALARQLLEDDPEANLTALLAALEAGATAQEVALTVVYAAALRIARFHTSNEFGDWDTALHTYSFASAIYRALRRISALGHAAHDRAAALMLRGSFDAAMSVYLDRFLNIPAAEIPTFEGTNGRHQARPEALLDELLPLFDRQQQVNAAGELVARYLAAGGDVPMLLARLGRALLREDRDFHTIQTVEASVAFYQTLRGADEAAHALVAAARYLAAHSPTVRSQGQTYTTALRLHRGDRLFEG
ncbi:MAG TPA: Rieske (2Fe-2S) protein [Ktedonobacterales bacterium]